MIEKIEVHCIDWLPSLQQASPIVQRRQEFSGAEFTVVVVVVVVAVPLGKSEREQEVAQSGQKEKGEIERRVLDEKGA